MARPSLARCATVVLLCVVSSLLVTACTGSQTTRTPVVVFLAGTDTSIETSTLRAFEIELPYDPATGTEPIRELAGFERTLQGSVIALTATRQGDPALYVLLRIDGVDTLARFDVAGLDTDVPGSLASSPDALVDLDAIVETPEGLDEELCARAITVTPDGSWLGLLHDPTACASSGPPAVLAIELTPDDPNRRGFGPPTLGTQDAAAAPTFVGRGDDVRLAWVRATGAVTVWSPLDVDAKPVELAVVELGSSAPALGRSGTGLAVAYDRDVRYVSLAGGELGPTWTVDDTGTLRDVVDADTLPGTSSIVVGSAGLAVLTDLDADPDDARIDAASVADADTQAVLGPYGYLYVLTNAELRTFDTLSAATGGALVSVPSATVDLNGYVPVAASWTFAEGGSVP